MGGVEALVVIVKEEHDHLCKVFAAMALVDLAQDGELRASMQDEGGVETLTSIVLESVLCGGTVAAAALGVTAGSFSIRTALYKTSTLRWLVTTIQNGRPAQQASAAETLALLALDTDNHELIVSAGALLPLMLVAEHGIPVGRAWASLALFRFGARGIAAARCSMEKLVAAILDGQLEPELARALADLTHDANGRAAIIDAGGIHALIALGREGPSEGRIWVAKALCGCAADSRGREVIATTGGVDVLLARLQLGTANEISWAFAALQRLAGDVRGCAAIIAAGGVEAIVATINGSLPSGRLHAAKVLAKLTKHSAGCVAVDRAGGREKLMVIRDGEDATGRSLAETALERLRAEKQGGGGGGLARRRGSGSDEPRRRT